MFPETTRFFRNRPRTVHRVRDPLRGNPSRQPSGRLQVSLVRDAAQNKFFMRIGMLIEFIPVHVPEISAERFGQRVNRILHLFFPRIGVHSRIHNLIILFRALLFTISRLPVPKSPRVTVALPPFSLSVWSIRKNQAAFVPRSRPYRA